MGQCAGKQRPDGARDLQNLQSKGVSEVPPAQLQNLEVAKVPENTAHAADDGAARSESAPAVLATPSTTWDGNSAATDSPDIPTATDAFANPQDTVPKQYVRAGGSLDHTGGSRLEGNGAHICPLEVTPERSVQGSGMVCSSPDVRSEVSREVSEGSDWKIEEDHPSEPTNVKEDNSSQHVRFNSNVSDCDASDFDVKEAVIQEKDDGLEKDEMGRMRPTRAEANSSAPSSSGISPFTSCGMENHFQSHYEMWKKQIFSPAEAPLESICESPVREDQEEKERLREQTREANERVELEQTPALEVPGSSAAPISSVGGGNIGSLFANSLGNTFGSANSLFNLATNSGLTPPRLDFGQGLGRNPSQRQFSQAPSVHLGMMSGNHSTQREELASQMCFGATDGSDPVPRPFGLRPSALCDPDSGLLGNCIMREKKQELFVRK